MDETQRKEPQRLHGPAVLVLSPHAGSGEAGRIALRVLHDAGVDIGEQVMVSELDRARSLGAEWRARGYRAAIAAGGDGTIGAVASHLAGSDLSLGILPMGTSNDTARSLGIPMALAEAARVIAAGRRGAIDAGQAVPAHTAPMVTPAEEAELPSALGAYFLHALTLGFNVEFARLATDVARRSRFGGMNYAASLVQTIATYRPVALTLRFEGLVEPAGLGGDSLVAHEALEVAAVNTPVFGGAFNFEVPDVGMHDRLLDFVVFEALDPQRLRATVEDALDALARLPERLPEAMLHHPPRQSVAARSDAELGLALPGIHRYKARAAMVESVRPLDVTLDGEVRARTPVRVRVAPQPVSILLPAANQIGIHEQ